MTGPRRRVRGTVARSDVQGSAGLEGGDYAQRYTGTSASAAMAAGVAALLISAYPELSAAQVRESIADSAYKIDARLGHYLDGHSIQYGQTQLTGYFVSLQALESSGSTLSRSN